MFTRAASEEYGSAETNYYGSTEEALRLVLAVSGCKMKKVIGARWLMELHG